jgi:hypothetical protein
VEEGSRRTWIAFVSKWWGEGFILKEIHREGKEDRVKEEGSLNYSRGWPCTVIHSLQGENAEQEKDKMKT